jgi:FkbM family methyltransferase
MASCLVALLLLPLTAPSAGTEICEQGASCTSELGGDANSMLQVQAGSIKDGTHLAYDDGIAKPWDGVKFLGSDGSHKCEWADMSSGPKMCCRSYKDAVSDTVKGQGGWIDCPALVSWWNFLHDRSQESGAVHGKFYVDVGANIGSCLLPMMAQQDVHSALAFEPSPANLFYLSNTLLSNPTIKDKVKLYPFALGDEDKTSPIYTEQGNAGNTVVGQATHASPTAVGQVDTKTLDEVVMKGDTPPYIHLMKMDAQGYEVKILQGASKLFSSGAVNAVKFELAADWLINQGTSAAEYMNTYLRYGFQIHDTNTKELVSQELLHSVTCGKPIIKDFVAVRVREGEVAIQKPVVC